MAPLKAVPGGPTVPLSGTRSLYWVDKLGTVVVVATRKLPVTVAGAFMTTVVEVVEADATGPVQLENW
jgi:hypothetical protein